MGLFSSLARTEGSQKGIGLGLLLFLLAFPLLWWNEGLAVLQAADTASGKKSVLSVTAVEAANEGRLIHVSGPVNSSQPLTDEFTHFKVQALRLHRKVEIFHWQESHRKTGYEYAPAWVKENVNSSQFQKREGHENKIVLPCAETTYDASDAHLGVFGLGSAVSQFSNFEPIVPSGQAWPEGFRLEGQGLYRGKDPLKPQVGDVRITYEKVPEGEYTVVAQQSAGGLTAFVGQGKEIFVVQPGRVPSQQIFTEMEAADTFSLWFVRALGLALMAGGLYQILRPLTLVAEVFPPLAGVTRTALKFLALLLVLPCALMVVGLAWLAARPLLAVVLLGAGGGGLFYASRKLT